VAQGPNSFVMEDRRKFKVIVWDLEGRHGKPEGTSMEEYKVRCGISVAVTQDFHTGDTWMYSDRDDGIFHVEELLEDLKSSDLIISYNGRTWDHVVLGAVTKRRSPVEKDLDIYEVISKAMKAYGYNPFHGGWKLGEVAERTIGCGKIGAQGAFASMLVDQERYAELYTYCWWDVSILRKLTSHMYSAGYVIAPDGAQVPVREELEYELRYLGAEGALSAAT